MTFLDPLVHTLWVFLIISNVQTLSSTWNKHANLLWINGTTAIIKRIFLSITMGWIVCGLLPYQIDNVFSNQSSTYELNRIGTFMILIFFFTLIPFLLRQTSNILSANLDAYDEIKRRHWQILPSARLLYFDDIIFCIVRILHLLM